MRLVVLESDMTGRFSFSSFLTVTSVVVATIALIPAFLSLNKEKAELYYSYSVAEYKAPEGIDEALFENFLVTNAIPRSNISIRIKNAGNAPCSEIKLAVDLPGSVVRTSFIPSEADNSAWVVVPPDKFIGLGSAEARVTETVKQLAPGKVLTFTVGYEGAKGKPVVEVYGNALEAAHVEDLASVAEWSASRVFYLPLSILGGGIVIALLWIAGSVIHANPEYRSVFQSVFRSILESFILGFPGGRLVVRSLPIRASGSASKSNGGREANSDQVQK